MKLSKKILYGSLFSTAAAITIIAVPTTLYANNEQNNSTSNNQTSALNKMNIVNDMNGTLANLVKSNNINGMIDNMSISKQLDTKVKNMNKNDLLKMINEKVNTLSESSNFATSYSNVLKQKATEIALNILSGKETISSLVSFLKNKYNGISKDQRVEMLNRIKQNELIKKSNTTQMLINNFASTNSGNEQFSAVKIQLIIELSAMAVATTGAATAATIVATAMWCIPFFGWGDAIASTAAAAADWVSTGLSWAAVAGINNVYTQIASGYLEGLSIQSTVNDIRNVPEVMQNLETYLIRAASGSTSDLAVNAATGWADPEAAAWLVPELTDLNIALDVYTAILGLGSLF